MERIKYTLSNQLLNWIRDIEWQTLTLRLQRLVVKNASQILLEGNLVFGQIIYLYNIQNVFVFTTLNENIVFTVFYT